MIIMIRTTQICEARANLEPSFRSENREQMAVYISEVRNPVHPRGLVWFGEKRNAQRRQGPMRRSHILHPKDDFRCPCDVRCSLNVSAT